MELPPTPPPPPHRRWRPRLLLLLVPVAFAALFLLPIAAGGTNFSPNVYHYVACGAGSSITSDSDSRTFEPDESYLVSSVTYSLTTVITGNDSTPSLYNAARISASRSPLSYGFTVDPPGTYVLRLHFFPSPNFTRDLTLAVFDVVADSLTLLSNFSAPAAPPVTIKEFLLPIDGGTGSLSVSLNPAADSFAFVNAIEVFSAPAELFGQEGATLGVSDWARRPLETIHRLNVGGKKVTPANDTWWRTWLPDNSFLLFASSNFQANSTTQNIDYYTGSVTEEIAPDYVYATARTLYVPSATLASNIHYNVNLTWTLAVDGSGSAGANGSNYIVRLHFCDITSLTQTSVLGAGVWFNVFVAQSMAFKTVSPKNYTIFIQEPFYLDGAVDLGNATNITISLGRPQLSPGINAFLNGLEVFRVFPSSTGVTVAAKSSNSLVVVLSSAIGGVVAVFAVVGVAAFFICRRRRRRLQAVPAPEKASSAGTWSVYTPNRTTEDDTSKSGEVTIPRQNLGLFMPLAAIKAATDDFNEGNVIGVGGFGKVYKGVLADGTPVAVKRASVGSRQGFPEFQTEIVLLSAIRHRHLVSLIAYCDEQSEMILVYEYMSQGPLRRHLYGSAEDDTAGLKWAQRLEICVGAARGLHYLHTGYSENIIHRDIKSTNILLGDGMVAKVSDFGLSRLGPSGPGETHVSTAVKGTFGYLDPEYFRSLKLTDRSDVYSFGVVLLEVLCARPVIDQRLNRDQVNLAEWALWSLRNGDVERIADAKLAGDADNASLRKFGETAERCLAKFGHDRPSMGDVLWSLEYCLQLHLSQVSVDDSGSVKVVLPPRMASPLMPSAAEAAVEEEVGEEDSVLVASQSVVSAEKVFSQLISDEGR